MKIKVQPGCQMADDKYYVTIMNNGPYLVYGNPPLNQQIIEVNEEGECWTFSEGRSFEMDAEPVALCRCGASKDKPYCDGAHMKEDWEPQLTAKEEPLLDGAAVYDGPELSLTDNKEYCVFARFCDAKGRVWNLVKESDDPEKREHVIHEANMCPGGRLSAWDKKTKKPFEPHYDPGLALIEDKPMAISGGLWIKGGIPVRRQDGYTYEVRNRVVLCRCGQSSNKPFCDGMHASVKWKDGLENKK